MFEKLFGGSCDAEIIRIADQVHFGSLLWASLLGEVSGEQSLQPIQGHIRNHGGANPSLRRAFLRWEEATIFQVSRF